MSHLVDSVYPTLKILVAILTTSNPMSTPGRTRPPSLRTPSGPPKIDFGLPCAFPFNPAKKEPDPQTNKQNGQPTNQPGNQGLKPISKKTLRCLQPLGPPTSIHIGADGAIRANGAQRRPQRSHRLTCRVGNAPKVAMEARCVAGFPNATRHDEPTHGGWFP